MTIVLYWRCKHPSVSSPLQTGTSGRCCLFLTVSVFTYTCVTLYDYCFILALQTPIRIIPFANGDEWVLALQTPIRVIPVTNGDEWM